MNYQELSELNWIVKHIKALKIELNQLEGIKGNQIADIPKCNKISKPTENMVILEEKYINKITTELERYMKKKLEIENFIDSIESEEIKILARYRFIYLKSWTRITMELYKGICDVCTPRKKLRRYINNINRDKAL